MSKIKDFISDVFSFKYVPVFTWPDREQRLTEFIYECYHTAGYIDINRWIEEHIILIDYYHSTTLSEAEKQHQLNLINKHILELKGFLKSDVNKMLNSGLFVATVNGETPDFDLTP